MPQVGDSARLLEEVSHIIVGQPHIEHFDGGLHVEVDVFAEVHISEAPPPQQLDEAIISKLLAHAGPGKIPFSIFHTFFPAPPVILYARPALLHPDWPKRCACRRVTMPQRSLYLNARDRSRCCRLSLHSRPARWCPRWRKPSFCRRATMPPQSQNRSDHGESTHRLL